MATRSLAVALTGTVLACSPAWAHGTQAGGSERALRAYETATLGAAHAAEHARERREARAALRRWARLTPRRRRASQARVRRADARARASLDAPLDAVGRWEDATVDLPTFAINAVMLPTGKVAFWGRPPLIDGTRENQSQFWLWDPVSKQLSRHDAPKIDLDGDGTPETPAPIFCSGQSLLADGELFIAGGNLGNPRSLGGTTENWRGLDRAYTFDPWTLTWTEQPRPRHGRWYPSQVELADGRIAILAGYNETGDGTKNIEMEVFTPAATRGSVGQLTYYPAGDRDTAFYPHLFTMPGGKVLLGGPDKHDSGLLDPLLLGDQNATPGSAWTTFAPTKVDRVGGNAILWPQGASGDTRVTLLGGYYYTPDGGDATADTETFDTADPQLGWTLNGAGIPAMNVGRSYGNLVQLPDGELVAVGGGAGLRDDTGTNYTAGDSRLKQVELLRPGVDAAWRLGPPQRKWRAYHSTAMLLPDGRILSAGDDYWYLGTEARPQGGDPMDVGEIYSPPYLFDGDHLAPRPVIDSAPDAVPYGSTFGVAVSGREAGRAVLVAPAATTHGADMNQRVVDLGTVQLHPGRGLDVRAPVGPDVAPPGYYMLFILDDAGTPSVARWVRLGADAPAPAPLPPDPTPTPTPPPPSPTPAPSPTPVPKVDRTPPIARLRLVRERRRVRLRLTLGEPGRATLRARLGAREVVRRLRFSASGATRTLVLTPPHGRRRLTVSVQASDAAGNTRRISQRWWVTVTR
jgi:hypothetical protein